MGHAVYTQSSISIKNNTIGRLTLNFIIPTFMCIVNISLSTSQICNIDINLLISC